MDATAPIRNSRAKFATTSPDHQRPDRYLAANLVDVDAKEPRTRGRGEAEVIVDRYP
jgi:hypothetical protein